jgi:adenylate kinase
MKLLFTGISGSGKDTQASLLTKKFNFHQIATGQLLRRRASVNDDFGKILSEGMQNGFLPDELIYKMLRDYLHAHQHLSHKLIFNGTVRHFPQIKLLDDLLASVNTKLDKVILFQLNEEVAKERLIHRRYCSENGNHIYHEIFNPPQKHGVCDIDGAKLITREDDNEESIHKRFAAFKQESDKIHTEYQNRGILIVVDANHAIHDVHLALVRALGL